MIPHPHNTMIQTILKDLHETWGFTSEELRDIEDKLETFGSSVYEQGLEDNLPDKKIANPYGKREDWATLFSEFGTL